MVHKFREAGLPSLEVGERHHGRRSVTCEKHWRLVDEVANGGPGSFLPVIDLRGNEVNRDLQLVAEKTEFFRLGFQVLPLRVRENKVEHSDAAMDVFDFVLPAIANVLAVDLSVEAAGKQMIERSALWKALRPRVFLGVKFVPEGGRALAPMGAGEGE